MGCQSNTGSLGSLPPPPPPHPPFSYFFRLLRQFTSKYLGGERHYFRRFKGPCSLWKRGGGNKTIITAPTFPYCQPINKSSFSIFISYQIFTSDRPFLACSFNTKEYFSDLQWYGVKNMTSTDHNHG